MYEITAMIPNLPIPILVENEGFICALFSFEGPDTVLIPKAKLRAVMGEAKFYPVQDVPAKLFVWKNPV